MQKVRAIQRSPVEVEPVWASFQRVRHKRTGQVSFRGAEVSCPNILSIACTKLSGFVRILPDFVLARKLLFEKFGGGAGGAAAPLSPMGRIRLCPKMS